MLAIRLKRVGRANLAQYRVIVQDSRRHPKRGAVVEYIGTYDPHAKTFEVDKDRVKHFLSNGAQPSAAAARLLKADGVKLPKWVTITKNPKRDTKNPEKLRKNQPKEDKPAEPAKAKESPVEEPKKEDDAKEATEEPKSEGDSKPEAQEEAKAEDPSSEAPKNEASKEATEEKPQESNNTKESTPKKSEDNKK